MDRKGTALLAMVAQYRIELRQISNQELWTDLQLAKECTIPVRVTYRSARTLGQVWQRPA
jgi:hypothetical protein